MNILFFCPTIEKSSAEQVLGTLHAAASKTDQKNIDTVDENTASFSLEGKSYEAVILVYTPEVEFSDTLFEIIHYIDQKRPPGRFILLPKTGEKKIIPPIFHSIRNQQQHLFFYPTSGQSPHSLEAPLAQFKEAWNEFITPALVDQPDGGKSRSKRVPFGPMLLFSIIIIILAGLIAVVISPAKKYLFSPPTTPIQPPIATAFWLQEHFQGIDTVSTWKVQHYYSGQQTIQTILPGNMLRLTASPAVTDAVFQLDSLQDWPLDELQSISFSFALSAMTDLSAKSALTFSLYLSENSAYHLDCLIIPAEADGKIQCQVQSPNQHEALSDAVSLSLNTAHTATLVFAPSTYTVQFFLDDHYYGQREIQSVEYWRTRSFNLQIRNQVQNLSTGSFSCDLDSIILAHQP